MGSADDHRSNNFDLLRLLAAAAVVVSHSFSVTGRGEPYVGTTSESLGTIAVTAFFGISGFLITRSWLRSPHLGKYIEKRILRILPAYVVVLLLAAFVIGPLVTTLSVASYFHNGWTYRYVLQNLEFWNTWYALPGVFAHNPYPFTVNGSIWTITFELRAYVIVAVFGVLGIARSRYLLLAGWVVIITLATVSSHLDTYLGDPEFLRAFAVGSVLYAFRDRLAPRWTVAIAATILWLALSGTSAGIWVISLVLPYITLVLGTRTPHAWSRLTRRGDFSYGMYLWAFPIQQLLAMIRGITVVEMIAAALVGSYLMGAVSWFLIEKRALGLKGRLPLIARRASGPEAARASRVT